MDERKDSGYEIFPLLDCYVEATVEETYIDIHTLNCLIFFLSPLLLKKLCLT